MSWHSIREQHQAGQFFLMRQDNHLLLSKKRFHSMSVPWRWGRMVVESIRPLSSTIQEISGGPRLAAQADVFPKQACDRKRLLQLVLRISGRQLFCGIGLLGSQLPQPSCGRVACRHLFASDLRGTVSSLRFGDVPACSSIRTFQQRKLCICLKSTLV